MKLCSWAPSKMKHHHPEFMAQVMALKVKEKPSTSLSMAPSTPADEVVVQWGQVRTEAAEPSSQDNAVVSGDKRETTKLLPLEALPMKVLCYPQNGTAEEDAVEASHDCITIF